MPEQRYAHLWTDADGESHFRDVDVLFDSELVAPPAPPLPMAVLGAAAGIAVLGADPEWDGSELHPSPSRQYLVVLQGVVELVASDGEHRWFQPGEVVLLDDATGRGHRTLSEQGGTALVVRLP